MGDEEETRPVDNGVEHAAGAEQADGAAQAGAEEDFELLLEDTRARADEHFDQLLRAQAELENLRRRSQRDLENAHKYGLEKFVGELLAVKDSMELGLAAANDTDDVASLREGMDLTLKMLAGVLEKFKVEVIDPAGDKFDPALHQAMSIQNSDEVEPGTILAVMQKGYRLHDRLVRPAMVIVAQARPGDGD